MPNPNPWPAIFPDALSSAVVPGITVLFGVVVRLMPKRDTISDAAASAYLRSILPPEAGVPTAMKVNSVAAMAAAIGRRTVHRIQPSNPRTPHPHLHPGAAATRSTVCVFAYPKIPSTNLKNELPCMERLGVARRRVALDAAKAQVAAEQVRIEPLVAALRGKAFQQRRDFLLDRRR